MTKKRNILITGATGGIGRAVALGLGDQDTTFFVVGRDREKLAELKTAVEGTGAHCTALEADFESEDSLEKFCEHVMSVCDTLDWIIHSAGYIDENESKSTPSHAHLTRAFSINTVAPIFITQTLTNILSPHGGVISISSTASLWGNPQFPIYAATKGALNTYTQALGKQFEGSEKTAVVICPGGTNTPMRERVAQDAESQQSPDVIAKCIKEIIEHRSEFKNRDIIIIKDGTVTCHEA